MRKIEQIERSFLALLGGLFLVALAAPLARAQDYPTRPITIVVPFTPGGTTDILGRMIGQRLEVRLGQSFLIENKPGAGSVIGANAVAKAVPDGYTLLMATSTSMAVDVTLYKEPALQSGKRLDSARPRCSNAVRLGGQSVAAGSIGAGPDQAREGQTGATFLRIGGSGHPASSLCRVAQKHDRHRDGACPLPGQPAVLERRGRGTRRADVRRRRSGGGNAASRKNPPAGRFDRKARRRVPGNSAARRGWLARLRCGVLADDRGACQDAAADPG